MSDFFIRNELVLQNLFPMGCASFTAQMVYLQNMLLNKENIFMKIDYLVNLVKIVHGAKRPASPVPP